MAEEEDTDYEKEFLDLHISFGSWAYAFMRLR